MNRRNFLTFSSFVPATVISKAASVVEGPIRGDSVIGDPQQPRITQLGPESYIERRSHALYDSMRLDAGQELVQDRHFFFVDPVGSHGRGSMVYKGFADTNMVRSVCLPPPQSMDIFKVAMVFGPEVLNEDLDALCECASISLQVSERVVLRSPLARSPLVGKVSEMFSTSDSEGQWMTPRRNRLQLEDALCLSLRIPIHIESLQYFQLTLQVHDKHFTPRSAFSLYAVLDGEGYFGIQ